MNSTITDKILMVRPANFGYNAETAENNSFQSKDGAENVDEIAKSALQEFDAMVDTLRNNDIEVIVIEDSAEPKKPDAIFPNNWFSTHATGAIVTYPMFAVSRRPEKREDIIIRLQAEYKYKKKYTFDYLEEEEQYLEGTGSMILDRENKIVYACLSQRTDIRLLEKFCVLFGYKKVVFYANDRAGDHIYHTNVMMALGVDFAVVCLDTISDQTDRDALVNILHETGKEVIEIDLKQMEQFAGNMLQVASHNGSNYIVMSEAARAALKKSQIAKLEQFTNILAIPIPTIEKYGGGSVRCMMAEIFPAV